MICTFGDITDVTWWRELTLPVRAVIQPNGTLRPVDVGRAGMGVRRRRARAGASTTSWPGSRPTKARARIVELLQASGDLHRRAAADHARREVLREGRSAARDHHQPAVVHQDDRVPRGAARARPRAAVAPGLHARALRELGERPQRRLVHQPAAVLRRAVPGLVSGARGRRGRLRQRRCVPDEARLPIDPSTDVPAGYTRGPARPAGRVRRRSRRHGHLGHLVADAADRRRRGRTTPTCSRATFPMDLRPQAHDIIRTWLFSTVLRAHLEHDSLPWTNAAISGWVLDPDRKKMSKSKGNVVTPMALLEEHGSDGVRYWAAQRRPGHRHRVRRRADEGRAAAGDEAAERLEVRAVRASSREGPVTEPLDRGMLTSLARPGRPTPPRELERYDYATALASGPRASSGASATTTSSSVKSRRYGDSGREAAASAVDARCGWRCR